MAFRAFLKIDGVTGDCQVEGHQGWIEISSYSHSLNQGGEVTKNDYVHGLVNVHEFVVTKPLDKASPMIVDLCCKGDPINSALLEICSASGRPHAYMKYTLAPCFISSVDISGNTERPTETVKFRFRVIKWEYTGYTGQRPDQPVRSGWNVPEAKAEA